LIRRLASVNAAGLVDTEARVARGAEDSEEDEGSDEGGGIALGPAGATKAVAVRRDSSGLSTASTQPLTPATLPMGSQPAAPVPPAIGAKETKEAAALRALFEDGPPFACRAFYFSL
jgi:hypothetical protein